MITVFYDGACGLCRKEIEHYKKIAPMGIFDWIDITKTPQKFLDLGYQVPEGLKALHVVDTDKIINKGVDAFIVIWRHAMRMIVFINSSVWFFVILLFYKSKLN